MKNYIPSSEITPEGIYLSRRRFIKTTLKAAGAALLVASCNLKQVSPSDNGSALGDLVPAADTRIDELGNILTPNEDILSYTNFYEFSTDKRLPTELAKNLITSPWTVVVDGLVNKPQIFDIDDLRNAFPTEERIYRMRCVEGWSMVIPWQGFPLKRLLDLVEPTSEAKYVRFETLFDPEQMPGQYTPFYPWPYVEGLRMDEAMHDLSILATGIYGKDLSPQNGAPIRLVVPWKYGFKSIKSIVKISLVDEMPKSLWMDVGPDEYGFYANVNPNVPHPRWSQATERVVGSNDHKDTLLFNGYGDQVAPLYQGMDLSIYF